MQMFWVASRCCLTNKGFVPLFLNTKHMDLPDIQVAYLEACLSLDSAGKSSLSKQQEAALSLAKYLIKTKNNDGKTK